MSTPAPKLATYADPPLPRHSHVQRSAGRSIGGPFQDDDGRGGPGGWWIFVEVDVQLDVDARTLEAFELVDHRWVRLGSYDETSVVAIPPFSQVELGIDRLFLPPPPAA